MSTEVRKCNCKNDFQDREYGEGNRLCNHNDKGGVNCTVCGAKYSGFTEVKKQIKK